VVSLFLTLRRKHNNKTDKLSLKQNIMSGRARARVYRAVGCGRFCIPASIPANRLPIIIRILYIYVGTCIVCTPTAQSI